MTTITMTIYANFDGAWTDITSDVLTSGGVTASWGMNSNKFFDRIAQTGEMRFDLENITGKYIPGGSAVISPHWKKGCRVMAVFTFAGINHICFIGYVNAIKIYAGEYAERKVSVTVLDWLDYAAKYPLDMPVVELDKRADEVITTILAGMPIQPTSTSLDVGDNVFPIVFSDTTSRTRAYSEFSKLVMSELGYLYLTKKGALVFENSTSRSNPIVKKISYPVSGFLLQENGDDILQENGDKILLEGLQNTDAYINGNMLDMSVTYGETLTNKIPVTVHPSSIAQNSSLVYSLDAPLYVPAGITKTFEVGFTEPNSKKLVAAIQPDSTYPTTLLHFNVVGESTIIEETGKSWGVQGGAGLYTEIKKFGAQCLYLDGGTDTYADAITNTDYDLPGDFTIEWWEYRFNATTNRAIVNRDRDASYPPYLLGLSDGTSSKIYMSSNGSSFDVANGNSLGVISLNTWVHYAVCRYGTTFYAFQNGILTDTWTSATALPVSTGYLTLGQYNGAVTTTLIDEFLIVKGLAKYTGNFTPPTEEYVLNGTFYSAYELSNRGGTDLTPNFTLDITYGGAGAEVVVENISTTNGYLTSLKVYANIVSDDNPITVDVEDHLSIQEYGYNEVRLDQPYQQDIDAGYLFAGKVLELEKQPRVTVNSVLMSANKDDESAARFLYTDIGDVVKITEAQSEVNGNFYIHSSGWTAYPAATGVNVNYRWDVEHIPGSGSYTTVIQSNGQKYIQYPYLPAVSADSVTDRLFSAWVYLENGAFPSDEVYPFSLLPSGNLYGVFLSLSKTTTQDILQFNTYRYTTGGNFISTATALSYNTWYHVAVRYNHSFASNTPEFFINGVSVALTSSTYPSGTQTSEVSVGLKVHANTNLSSGRVKDARVYNMGAVPYSSSSYVASIYADGAYVVSNTEGLVFKMGRISSDDYTDYLNTTLPTTAKVYDIISGAEGTPTGSPTLLSP